MASNTPHIDRKAIRNLILSEAAKAHGEGRITQVSEDALAHLDRLLVKAAIDMASWRDGTSKTIKPRPVGIPPSSRRAITS